MKAIWAGAGLVLVFAGIQAVPVKRVNPPAEGDLTAPPAVRDVLHRACYDCHSNETRWPWYSHVAPVSWVLVRNVRRGRRHINFSLWGGLDARRQAKARRETRERVSDGQMPVWFHAVVHPETRLSAEDKAVLLAWREEDRRSRTRQE